MLRQDAVLLMGRVEAIIVLPRTGSDEVVKAEAPPRPVLKLFFEIACIDADPVSQAVTSAGARYSRLNLSLLSPFLNRNLLPVDLSLAPRPRKITFVACFCLLARWWNTFSVRRSSTCFTYVFIPIISLIAHGTELVKL